MRREAVIIIMLASLIAVNSHAQSTTPVQYFHDDRGRLTRVIDPNGNSATYSYDAVGNLLSITRSSVPANNSLAILGFSPHKGPVGQTVSIQGQGFNATPTANTVQFNGTTSIVTSATANTLTVTVPTGATTGPISVTVSGTTVSSDTNFTVAPVTLLSISISPMGSTISAGDTEQLGAFGLFDNFAFQDMTASVTWSSSSPGVASISNAPGSQGLATGVSNGLSQITATSGSISGSGTVTVKALTGISVTPSTASSAPGSTQQFTATVYFNDGTSKDVTSSVMWASSNTSVATISNAAGSQGLAATLADGSTVVTAKSGGLGGSASLNVISLVSISVTPTNIPILKGTTRQFTATGNYSDGSTKPFTTSVSWSSSNPSVALVGNVAGSQGLVRTVGLGTATVTATQGTLRGSASLSVTVSQVYQGTVYGGDGQTPDPGEYVEIYDAASGAFLTFANADANGFYQVSSVGPSSSQGVNVVGYARCNGTPVKASGTATSPGQPITVNLTMPLAVIKGQVTFYDATPVPYPNVFVTGADCYGQPGQTFFPGSLFMSVPPDASGNYVFLAGMNPGAFTIFAQDPQTGLSVTSAQTLNSISSAVVANLALPPTGNVTGTVFDSNGVPVPAANIQLYSSVSEFLQSAVADGQGNYAFNQPPFNQAPVGAVVVTATPQNMSGPLGAAYGSLTSPGGLLTLNVNLQPTSTVSGTVIAKDGVSPVPNAQIAVENANLGSGIADYYFTGGQSALTADASGNFSVSNIPVGPVRVVAVPPDNSNPSAITNGTLVQNNVLIVNPTLGNAFNFNFGQFDLYDQNSFLFDVDCDGSIISGAGAYVIAARPDLDPFCQLQETALMELGGRQVSFGPRPLPGSSVNGVVQVGRKVFVPQNGGFARYLEILTNPLNTPVTVTQTISSIFALTPDKLITDPATTGNTFAVMEQACSGPFCSGSFSRELAFAFDGTGSSVPATAKIPFGNASSISYGWTVTVPPGQTVILMHFLIQRSLGDTAGATSQAQALVNLTDPNALFGMSAQEKAEVVNFNVP